MSAFLAMVEGCDGYVGGPYFGKQHIHARRQCADQWNDGEIGGVIVERMRHWDQYEEDGKIPLPEILSLGWWAECDFCGSRICEDEEEYQDGLKKIDDAIGTWGGPTYCSQRCADERDKMKKRQADENVEAYRQLESCLLRKLGPGVEFDYASYYAGWRNEGPFEVRIVFKVPDTKHSVSFSHAAYMPGMKVEKATLRFSECDREAVTKYWFERTGIVLGAGEENES